MVQTGDVFYPFEKGMLGGGTYERVIPAHFGGDGDDIFMRSVLKNYALELKTDEDVPKPTGKFILDEVQAKALASEVLGTHKGLTGAALKGYMDTYWAKSWGHFDVNKSALVELRDRALLHARVHVEDAVVPGGDERPHLEQLEHEHLGLEARARRLGLLHRAEHPALADLLLLHALQAHADVLLRQPLWDFKRRLCILLYI